MAIGWHSVYFQAKMVFRVGLIADVQYADIDDIWNFMKTHKRKYRATLTCLKNAVDWWLTQDKMNLVIDLGDAIDGFRNTDRDMGMHALTKVMKQWKRIEGMKVPHLLGNHELYKFTRAELATGVGSTGFHCVCPESLRDPSEPGDQFYYSFLIDPSSKWRVVVLDSYAESVMRNGGGRVGIELTLENGGLDREYTELCQSNNPNDILKASNYFAGLSGVSSRWCPLNGGLGLTQLTWLKSTLDRAEEREEKVIIASHVILHPKASPGENCHTIVWDYDKVLSVIEESKCVKLVLCGHAHHEGYFHCPKSGIHHISLPSPLEAPDEFVERTFGMLELSDDSYVARIVGQGWVTSRELVIR
jgi:manganese-dependent ADP-ribose/CDP-alcohol diphosphatase